MKNIHRVRRGDRVHKYHRKTRAKLPDLPENHPTFIKAWMQEEERGVPAPKTSAPGTLGAACNDYLGSQEFAGFSEVYARVMRKHIDEIRLAYGRAPLSDLRDSHIEADLARHSPHTANHRLKAWRKLAPKASKGIGKRKTPKTGGYPPWTLEHVEAYRARWPIGSIQRAAGELLFWTGARTIDAVRLAKSQIGRDGLLTYRQSKTGAKAHVPWTSALPAWAADWERDRAILQEALAGRGGFTFLETDAGKVRSNKGLGNLISEAAQESGFRRSAHGLRKTRLTLIAEADGTTQAIMAWGGHLSLEEAEHYTRAAQRKKVLLVNGGEAVYRSGG